MKLINGDCLEEIKELESNSIEAIVTDPPYELTDPKKQRKLRELELEMEKYKNPIPEDIEDIDFRMRMVGWGFDKRYSFTENEKKIRDDWFANCPPDNPKYIELKEQYDKLYFSGNGFMGKKWDGTGIACNVEMWSECLRVLKPGGYLLSFSATRTYHRMTCAIEDAGFEIRDMIEWVYGSGFPKSLNIGKAVDKLQRNEREYVGQNQDILTKQAKDIREGKRKIVDSFNAGSPERNNGFKTISADITKGTSEWEGWGTALKPAHEPICMARKPLAEKTVAENCLKWGVGGVNIDISRVESTEFSKDIGTKRPQSDDYVFKSFDENTRPSGSGASSELGRFPANLIHDNSEEVRECFPETGKDTAHARNKNGINKINDSGIYGKFDGQPEVISGFNDNGGNASRFFKSIPKENEIITCNSNQKQYTMSNLFTNSIICKNTFVSSAERLLKIIQAIKENTVLLNADDSQEEKLDQLVKNAEKNADLGEIIIALNLVAIKGKQGELVYQEVLNHFRDYTEDYKKCFQLLNLVKSVEICDNIDITEITANLLKSFGSAQSAIEENTHYENLDNDDLKGDYKSLIYQAKASKSERGDGNIHPTVKSLKLMEYLINMVTREGQTVLDPFLGSGTTGVACKNLNREFIGIELDKGYFEIAKNRIETNQIKLC